jgi:hypothetical protein
MPSDNLDRNALRAHQDWLGFLRPEGLVVAPTALVEAQAFVDANVADAHAAFLLHIRPMASLEYPEPVPGVLSFPAFAQDVLGWPADRIVRDGLPEPYLPQEAKPLRPTFGVREGDGWLLLGQEFDLPVDLDATPTDDGHGWAASPQAKFERLLRESRVPIGLLFNRAALRLVYAPAGESTGHLTFPFGVLAKVEGRIALAALRMLLGGERLFTLPDGQRLPEPSQPAAPRNNRVMGLDRRNLADHRPRLGPPSDSVPRRRLQDARTHVAPARNQSKERRLANRWAIGFPPL